LAAALERSAAEYAAAADRLESIDGDLLGALGRHVNWTSAATHPVLPLLATDAGIALQVETGIASHRRRFGSWEGGFWLPECGHAPWLDSQLVQAGVRSTCVELTRRFGIGDPSHLQPLVTDANLVLWPIDRQTIARVWSQDGYPSSPAYRSYHALTEHHHRVWRNDGAPYDPGAAAALVQAHARDFVAGVIRRLGGGGICVCALDTELLGHWWYEGVLWLSAVLDEAARKGLALTTLDDALEVSDPKPAPPNLGITSWGEGGDLRTWSGQGVADIAWQARTLELAVVARGRDVASRALRELLALQSSDWAFLVTRDLAGDYPRERARGHAEVLAAMLDGDPRTDEALRNLAPEIARPRG
jgi:1,4-alpha-glucan branching enzyme